MNILMKKLVAVPLRHVIAFCLFFSVAIITLFFFIVEDERIAALLGGISGGLLGVAISFLFSIYEHMQNDRFRAMGVLDILPDRRDTSYYKNIVKNAQKIVLVMGTSCIRFIEDFADPKSDDRVLIDALNKHDNLKLTLLVPTEENMDNKSKLNFEAGKEKLEQLQNQFGDRVAIKRYNFEPRHSLVWVDGNLIVGPVFQEVESKNSPAIHLTTDSAYAKKYLDYVEWVLKNRCP